MNRLALPPFHKIISSLLRNCYPWAMVALGMLFYCLNYLLRVSPSTMGTELSQTFHITATQLGILASCYYFAYTPMQIPAGMLYDMFSVRLVLFSSCLIAVGGLTVFIQAHHFFTAAAGRFMIGLGTAFAYIGTLKLAAIWLPKSRFALVAGLTTALGMLSAIIGQSYFTETITQAKVNYKHALYPIIFLGISLSFIMMFFLKSHPKDHPLTLTKIKITQPFTTLKALFTNSQMWIIGIIGCLIYLPSSIFLDLWGIPYLEATHHLSKAASTAVANCTFYGWIIFGPVIGIISDKIQSRRIPLAITSVLSAALLCFVFYYPHALSLTALHYIFFMVGACCSAQSLCFVLSKESNPLLISGTAVAVTNMMIMVGGAIGQPLVGKLLDLHTTSPLGKNGLPIYTGQDYTFAMSVLPIGVVLSVVLIFFLKETYHISHPPHPHPTHPHPLPPHIP